MGLALQKTLALLLLILLGFTLRRKINAREKIDGIKTLILSVALPAMIFVALLKIDVEPALLILPVLALGFNLIMLTASRYILPVFGVKKDAPGLRTLMMLLPSLAPGLSCFPFIITYLGDEPLAWAALADVGNKVFVLIVLYLWAMRWYYRRQSSQPGVNRGSKIRDLLLSLVKEPVNMVIITALLLLSFNMNMQSLPGFFQDSILKVSAIMTPLVLIFIGLAVKIKWQDFRLICSLLAWRAGAAFFLSAILLSLLAVKSPAMILLIVVFPQSATSFWPFAHMSAVNNLEDKNATQDSKKTFDLELSLAVLACSLPFSSILILMIFSMGGFFATPSNLVLTGSGFFLLAAAPLLIRQFSKQRVGSISDQEKVSA
ncbi:MAG: permease [Cytophagales bacterium]|nr:permease [Cytophagales bacterium]